MRRREFIARAAMLGGVTLLAVRSAPAQQEAGGSAASQQSGSSGMGPMDQDAARRVTRPAKPGAQPSMSAEERDALEQQIRCQCGCTLDVYICRTTDFACQVSPAMHRDVITLVDGGHSAQEILDAFVETYGERALMAPKREGFNWAGYLVPSAAIAAGAGAVFSVLRRMQRRAAPAAAGAGGAPSAASSLGTPDELARLDAAVRRDD